ncbi:VOC family protein [Cellulomonas hominis]|uniref:VOC family protein n=1 Tax=Cellulomonas hominis TaxID=156981 RepID=A0A7Z8JYP3_9CELL|nr:VOC family protein [Cellulomonas hominis]TKR23548.1 VOC family protein [Cellulomonas hominis]
MEVLGIDNVFRQVGDLDQAVAFYTGVLGLRLHRRFDAMGTALFAVGDEVPGLGVQVVDAPRTDGHRVWVEVPDARAAARELTDRGATLCAPPFEVGTGWTVEVADPWGNVTGFTDYVLRPELGRPAAR